MVIIIASHRKVLESFEEEEFNEKINDFNKMVMNEFLERGDLSDKTLKQYRSDLMIFFTFVYNRCDNKPLHELRSRHALNFQNYMISNGLSDSSVKNRRYAISSLCNHIENYYDEEYPMFKNITKALPKVGNNKKNKKDPLTKDEFEELVRKLEDKEDYRKLSYLLFSYASGCRREEARQLLKEVVNYEKHINKRGEEKDYYFTHKIRAKGEGKSGHVRVLPFDERTMDAIKKWLEIRGDDDCPYVFTSKRNGKHTQVSANTFNNWCDEFSKLIGKKVHPHLIRSTRATISHIEDESDIRSIQNLLGHTSSETTEIYIVKDEDEELDDLF